MKKIAASVGSRLAVAPAECVLEKSFVVLAVALQYLCGPSTKFLSTAELKNISKPPKTYCFYKGNSQFQKSADFGISNFKSAKKWKPFAFRQKMAPNIGPKVPDFIFFWGKKRPTFEFLEKVKTKQKEREKAPRPSQNPGSQNPCLSESLLVRILASQNPC